MTSEVLVHPPGAGSDDFLWRVSIADVEQAGDFSSFPGVDRIMAILSGRLALTVAGNSTILECASAPLAYPGDVPTFGRPLGGMVRDINLMVRRGGVHATMRRSPAARFITTAQTSILIAETGASIAIEGRNLDLAQFDAVVLAAQQHVTLSGPGLILEIDVASPAPARLG